ncbi:MAG: DNA-processing protein DprA [Bacteroidales bacterium]|nr:DNA-processing protein DprA [Bacteroidales bacterium]
MISIYSLALSKTYGIGPAVAKKLLELYPTAEELFNETPKALKTLFGSREKTINAILNKTMFSDCEKELNFIEKNGIKAYFFKDKEYPFRLKQIDDPPICLFVRGNGNLDTKRTVAIVGTRNPSDYGKWITSNIVHYLRQYNVATISGLAYGVDSITHLRSLAEDIPTFGVLGHGLDKIYPTQNWDLAKSMCEKGALVSDFFSGTDISPHNFPRRNRIIAALCDACIVVESKTKGGSLITASLAQDYNREVFAVPGRLGDVNSAGCNKLIALNQAIDLCDLEKIAETMNWDKTSEFQQPIIKNERDDRERELNPIELKVYQYIKENQKVGLDSINENCSLGFSVLNSTLMSLELRGFIKILPGKIYEVFH